MGDWEVSDTTSVLFNTPQFWSVGGSLLGTKACQINLDIFQKPHWKSMELPEMIFPWSLIHESKQIWFNKNWAILIMKIDIQDYSFKTFTQT